MFIIICYQQRKLADKIRYMVKFSRVIEYVILKRCARLKKALKVRIGEE